MKIIKSMLLLLTGVAFGVGFVLSCGDDSPRRTDAATCDCPASEPPLAGRLISNESAPVTISAGMTDFAVVGCSPGQQVLSGSCGIVGNGVLRNVVLQQSSLDAARSGWLCQFKDGETFDVQVKATVLCLKAAM